MISTGDTKVADSTSVLADLTEAERRELDQRAASQIGDVDRGGAIDLMQWPGWSTVLDRQFQERSSQSREFRCAAV
jgi:hypothetical protein